MKKYIKPTTETHPADACILSESTTMSVIIGGNVPIITDGEEILSPKYNLWDGEEEE